VPSPDDSKGSVRSALRQARRRCRVCDSIGIHTEAVELLVHDRDQHHWWYASPSMCAACRSTLEDIIDLGLKP
jgi:hypothetical protein